jgi:uncharacterized protein (TIGR00296 family)
MILLSLEEGKLLVALARRTIDSYLETGKKPAVPRVGAKLRDKCGVFVTLTKRGELRGCIGYPLPALPLIEAVMDAAVSSAVRDPRFPPVTRDDLPDIKIEISVLTPPEVIKVKDPCEYSKHVEVGKHGLIVECSGFAGLLLPQVPVDCGWAVEEFLSNTCMKAGLMPDCWLRGDACISRFSAQIFAEKEPGGQIVEIPLFKRKAKG